MFQRGVVSNYANNNELCGGVSLAPCSGDKFHQALKGGLIVGFALSLTCYIVISKLMERLTSTIWLGELRDATNCFAVDNAIGVGKMGMMYQGFLPNGQLLAVKRLFDSRLFKRQFLLETAILYDNFEPKISNFAEARFMNPNIEDHLGVIFKVNDGKKDVYDFGSVLLELITGETYNELSRSYDTYNLRSNPLSYYNVIGKSMTGEGLENEVCTLLKIADAMVFL
ncbi:unnamed protein product [Trifolium pratense]|uniref:Uncharacterized protein n=1 Tax=Trifolium pratense TaxID=57577 RepID=A0ACB0MF30_TRIPR|nr:unnamed protein product [Trifolium pratense]